MTTNLRRRLGRFYIPIDFLKEHTEAVFEQLSPHFFPVRCESRWDREALEIIAMSPHFDEVEIGMDASPYKAVFEMIPAEGVEEKHTIKFVEFKRES